MKRLVLGLLLFAGCRSASEKPASSGPVEPGARSPLSNPTASSATPASPTPIAAPVPATEGREIVVCGRRFYAGAPVVLWTSPPSYDASSEHARFGPDAEGPDAPKGPRYQPGRAEKGTRGRVLVEPESEDLERLRAVVDQFVLHYDAAGSSRKCFEILQDRRGLSVHFLLDVDGTIYQTLDLRDQAWHATKANPRSIGVEIANLGIPADGKEQPAFTDAQYASLAKLAAALCSVFPKITPDAPRDAEGRIVAGPLDEATFASFHGILGHSHVQSNKQDPGPAFDWTRFLRDVHGNLGL